MNRDDARLYVLDQEPYFLEKAKAIINGHQSYICPRCKNGSGNSGTGIALDITNDDKRCYKCFKCDLYEDVIGLWKEHTGIQDNKQAFPALYEFYGLQVEDRKEPSFTFPNEQKQPQQPAQKINTALYPQEQSQQPVKEEQDFTAYYKECQSRICNTLYLTGRGISTETAIKFGIGYDPRWKHPKSTYDYTHDAIIIPTSQSSYVARLTKPYVNQKTGETTKVMKVNHVQYFNGSALYSTDKPVFIVEGEIDALSILEAGGQALALGSAGNQKDLIAKVTKVTPARCLILALDNDEAGRDAQSKLSQELTRLAIPHISTDTALLFNGGKDANDALIADRESLKDRCREAEFKALEEERRIAYLKNEDYLRSCGKNPDSNAKEQFKQAIRNSSITAISTGFFSLDTLLDGGLYEGLYIIGAISSLGKTTFVLQIADQIARAGTDVLICSLEMSRFELYAKSISRITAIQCHDQGLKIDNAKTTRGITVNKFYSSYDYIEKKLIEESTDDYFDHVFPSIYVYEGLTGGDDVSTAKIRNLVGQHIRATGKTPVVVVDYLQILAPADPKATDKQATDQNVKELKRISRDFKTPVIAISSFNRENYSTSVSMLAFKESGAIEYSSDVLIGLQLKGAGTKGFDVDKAKSEEPRNIELKILKNRNGKTGGQAELKFYAKFNYFHE